MEVILHTIDHLSSRYDVTNAEDEEQVLAGLHPDKAFGHHHLAVHTDNLASLIVSSKITFVELRDVDRTDWPFEDTVFAVEEISKQDYVSEESTEARLLAELHLSDGKSLSIGIHPLETAGILPCARFMVDELLVRPSLHIRGLHDRVLLINGAHILRCDVKMCPHGRAHGWKVEPVKAAEEVPVSVEGVQELAV